MYILPDYILFLITYLALQNVLIPHSDANLMTFDYIYKPFKSRNFFAVLEPLHANIYTYYKVFVRKAWHGIFERSKFKDALI